MINQHHKSAQDLNNVMLHMECNRNLVNRIEIKRLENKFQVTMNKIIKVKKRNQLISTIQACLVGFLGTTLIVEGVCSLYTMLVVFICHSYLV